MITGAMELGKVLTPESCLLHVVSSKQEEGESRCNETEWARGDYPVEKPPLCCARWTRSG
jgi:hypothetical protein